MVWGEIVEQANLFQRNKRKGLVHKQKAFLQFMNVHLSAYSKVPFSWRLGIRFAR